MRGNILGREVVLAFFDPVAAPADVGRVLDAFSRWCRALPAEACFVHVSEATAAALSSRGYLVNVYGTYTLSL